MAWLQQCDPNEHSAAYLFPSMMHHLYAGSSVKNGEEIGAAVIAGIKDYLGRLSSQLGRTQMKGVMWRRLEDYLFAISHDFDDDAGQEALNEALKYCIDHWNEIVSA